MPRNNGYEKSKTVPSRKRQQIIIPKIVLQAVSETVATSMLLCLGCMTCIATDSMELPHHLVAVSFGLVIMIIIQIFGHISGAHINPCVTLVALLLDLLKPLTAVVYCISQIVGALLGFGLLKVLVPAEYTRNERINPLNNETVHTVGLCSTVIHPKLSVVQALGLEVILTITLALLCCSVWDKRNVHNTDSITLRFGLALAAIGIIGGPWTGASMNPARSLAPAIFNKDWEHHWIYWVGPIIGAVVGTIFYKTIFSFHEEENLDDNEDSVEDVPLKEKSNRV